MKPMGLHVVRSGHESGTQDDEQFLNDVEGESCTPSRWMFCRENTNSVSDTLSEHGDGEWGHVPRLGTNLPEEMADESHSEESDRYACENLRRIVCVVSMRLNMPLSAQRILSRKVK